MTSHLVLASDRGPVSFVEEQGRPVPRPRPGSVTAILLRAARSLGGVQWVVPTTSVEDVRASRSGLFAPLYGPRGPTMCPVAVDPGEHDAYYNAVGVRMLWYALHDLWDEVGRPARAGPSDEAGALAAYRSVSRRVADRVASACGPGSPVLVHDYQLFLVPGLLRRRRPAQPIGFFLHTPFTGPESWAGLPGGLLAEILDGVLGADLVAFQCAEWAESFLRCCRDLGITVRDRTVEHRGRRTAVAVYPIGIDVEAVVGRTSGYEARRWAETMRTGPDTRLVVRVDRLDPAKNVLRGFEAFELLLERRPDLRGKVRFVACFVPSRPSVPEYRDYARRVDRVIARVLARFPGSVTVHHGHDLDRAMAALQAYDVLLVNSLLDGMNLVAQEGPVANAREGVVVLSSRTGSAALLGDLPVRLTDPSDVGETAAALELALSLPKEERRRRAGLMRSTVSARCPEGWLSEQVMGLRAAHAGLKLPQSET